MKKIIVGIVTVLCLTLIQSTAHADTCINGTINVDGINTFGQLPCSDPGTEINVTIRGLHDYGVPNGPTAYCSFTYVRRNLGTITNPNWSVSTDTVCDPKPVTAVPKVLITETEPDTNRQTSTAQTSFSQTSECSAINPCMNYAVVNSSNSVVNVIVCQPSFCSGMTDSNGNRYIPQEAANPITHDYHGTNARISIPEENKIVTVSEDGIFTVTQNGQVVEIFDSPEVIIEKINTFDIVKTTSIGANFGNNYYISKIIDGVEQYVLVTNSEYVKINATETIDLNTVKETVIFEERKTEEEFVYYINNSDRSLMKRKISMLTKLFKNTAWFL